MLFLVECFDVRMVRESTNLVREELWISGGFIGAAPGKIRGESWLGNCGVPGSLRKEIRAELSSNLYPRELRTAGFTPHFHGELPSNHSSQQRPSTESFRKYEELRLPRSSQLFCVMKMMVSGRSRVSSRSLLWCVSLLGLSELIAALPFVIAYDGFVTEGLEASAVFFVTQCLPAAHRVTGDTSSSTSSGLSTRRWSSPCSTCGRRYVRRGDPSFLKVAR